MTLEQMVLDRKSRTRSQKAGGVGQECLFPKGFNLQLKKGLWKKFGASRVHSKTPIPSVTY